MATKAKKITKTELEESKTFFEKIEAVMATDYFVFSFIGLGMLAFFLFVQNGVPLK